MADGIVGAKTWAKLGVTVGTGVQTARKITKIILHCSATPKGEDFSVETIRQWHLQRGFNDYIKLSSDEIADEIDAIVNGTKEEVF